MYSSRRRVISLGVSSVAGSVMAGSGRYRVRAGVSCRGIPAGLSARERVSFPPDPDRRPLMKKRAAKPDQPSAAPRPAASKGGGSDRLAELQRLIQVMVEQDVVEVEYEDQGTRWRVRRKDPQAVAFAAPAAMALPAVHAQAAAAVAPAMAPAGAPATEPQ